MNAKLRLLVVGAAGLAAVGFIATRVLNDPAKVILPQPKPSNTPASYAEPAPKSRATESDPVLMRPPIVPPSDAEAETARRQAIQLALLRRGQANGVAKLIAELRGEMDGHDGENANLPEEEERIRQIISASAERGHLPSAVMSSLQVVRCAIPMCELTFDRSGLSSLSFSATRRMVHAALSEEGFDLISVVDGAAPNDPGDWLMFVIKPTYAPN